MTEAEVLDVLSVVKVMWPHTSWDAPPRAVGQVWHAVLHDLPADAVRATLIDMSGREFAPPPGVLRAAVLDRIVPDPTPGLDEAWAEVRRGIAEWGYMSPAARRTWSHPAVADAVAGFGWLELCESENPVADRAHFARFYGAAVERHRPERAPANVLAALAAARDAVVERPAITEGEIPG